MFVDRSDPAAPSLRAELRALARLAAPIVAVQLGLRAMNTVDVLMVGRVSGDAMAAVSVGNAWSWFPSIFCMGLLMATDPLFSQAVGADDDEAISRTMQRGLVWAIALTVPAMWVVWQIESVLSMTEQPPHIVPDAVSYAEIVSVGILPMLVFGVVRQSLQAVGRLRSLLITIVIVNLVNVLANWMLIFGNLGAPALGVAGSAWATVISRWLMAILLIVGSWPLVGRHILAFRVPELRRRALRLGPLLRLGRLGLPIGTQISLELGVFAATTLTIGSLGALAVAGHQVTLDLASISFMVPMGLGAAGAVQVGRAVGRGDHVGARRSGWIVLAVSAAVMTVSAALFVFAPTMCASFYTTDLEVVALAALLLPIAGVFQLFDGLQIVAVGVLRGLGDTRTPMWVNLIGFWVIGFPAGLWMCFSLELGAAGMWWGLVIGLACVAVGLLFVVRAQMRHERARLSVE